MKIDTEGFVYTKYQILTGEYQWKTIDLSQPFAGQIRGMRGYRIWDGPVIVIQEARF